MFLVRLVYVSQVTDSVTEDDVQQILGSARKNNAELEVTGLLCFNRKYFLQCLEGSREKVNNIYHKICNDKRHNHLVLLDYQAIDRREFGDWTMGYVPDISLTENLNLKYSSSKVFSPYQMSGQACHDLLMELSLTVPVI